MERLIGTMMRMVHDDLPGTTFSNTGQRGEYDSDGQAALTLAELQAWLALAVACYHGEVHERSGEEAINQRTLLLAAYAGPTERHRLFERELA